MGSARDSAPDPNHTSSKARSLVPVRLRSRPPSTPASASAQQSSRAILTAVDRITPRATVSGNGRPPGQQPKPLDRLREALRAFEYSLRTEQSHWRTMLPEAVKGPLRERRVRLCQIHQRDLTERYGNGSPAEDARRRKMQPPITQQLNSEDLCQSRVSLLRQF